MEDFNRTTFVIGAGASVDFGFPTGNDLIQTISWLADSLTKDSLSNTQFSHKFFQDLRSAAFSRFNNLQMHELRILASRVRDGLWLSASIDNFLNEQGDSAVADLGKFLIVASILLHERYHFPRETQQVRALFREPNLLWSSLVASRQSEKVGFAPLRSSWLVPFFRLIRGRGGIHDFNERLEKLTLIIFNYDRSVEFFLHQALMTYDQMSSDAAYEYIKKIQMIHPYGVAAELEFQNEIIGRPYGGINDQSFIELLKRKPLIQTFAERSAGYFPEEAQDAIRRSKNLIFMGFGFLEQNLTYLGYNQDLIGGPDCRRKVYATTYGLSDFQRGKNLEKIKNFQFASTRTELKHHFADASRVMHLNGTASELMLEYGSEWF